MTTKAVAAALAVAALGTLALLRNRTLTLPADPGGMDTVHVGNPIGIRDADRSRVLAALEASPAAPFLMIEEEIDGRWIAEVGDLPGVLAYGATREQALAIAQALALRVLAQRLEHGEARVEPFSVTFRAA